MSEPGLGWAFQPTRSSQLPWQLTNTTSGRHRLSKMMRSRCGFFCFHKNVFSIMTCKPPLDTGELTSRGLLYGNCNSCVPLSFFVAGFVSPFDRGAVIGLVRPSMVALLGQLWLCPTTPPILCHDIRPQHEIRTNSRVVSQMSPSSLVGGANAQTMLLPRAPHLISKATRAAFCKLCTPKLS